MSIFGILLLAGMTFTSCGEKATEKKAEVSTTAESIPFTNGVTDANKGNKRGTIEVKGSITAPAAKKMYIYSTYGRTNTKIDSVVVSNGTFSFGKKEYDRGIYMIGLADNNITPIILNPDEALVEVQFKSAKIDGGAVAVSTKENEGLWKYIPQEIVLLKAIKDARVAAHKSSIKTEFEKQALNKEIELANLQGNLIKEYPNTYLAKLLTWKQEPNKTDKTKYWENIDFSDESIIRSLALSDRIQNFMRSFSGGKEAGFIDCIALIADKAKANNTVLEFSLNQMLIGFYESGMENISTYIIDNYINGDSCGDADLSNIIKSTAEGITKLSVGNTPPNITGTLQSGGSFDLMGACAKNKYTLVMFWSSWCEHCQGEAPEVKACYEQWKGKGFELVGYSVDTNKMAWEKAITDRGFTFPNLCGYKQWDSKSAKDYRITKTPGFFLLDSSGKIVLKPKGIREVQSFLSQNIK